MIIYKATNKLNGMSYIGQTIKKLKQRKSSHISSNKKTYFSNALNKYGEDNFEWEVIERCKTKEELDLAEEWNIRYYNTLKPNGYNLTLGGSTGTYGWIPTNKNKKNISKGIKNFWNNVSDEYRKKWGERYSGENNPMFDKKIKRPYQVGENNPAKRLEVRKKISEANKGRKISEEWKNKISEKLKGRKFTEEQRINHKQALQNSDKVGRFKRTEEIRENCRKSKIKYIYEAISPKGEIIKFYSIRKFSTDNNLNRSSIAYHIKNNTSNYKGWKIKILSKTKQGETLIWE